MNTKNVYKKVKTMKWTEHIRNHEKNSLPSKSFLETLQHLKHAKTNV